jgi:hypothetical protein
MRDDLSPYEMSDETANAWLGLFQALGFVVIHWGLIERQIDNWIGRLFHEYGGNKLRSRGDIPVSLKQKLLFLSVCFNKIPEIATLRIEGRRLISRAKAASKRRNDLMHGSITSLESHRGIFRFEKIDYLPERQTLREFTLSHPDFQEFLPILTELVTDVIAFSQKLAAVPPRSTG